MVNHGGDGVMVWGCMASIDVGNTKLDLEKSFRFQHDSDPKHTAEIMKRWLLYNDPNQLLMAPQSSDLNPTEHV
ncbi:hypothetical protein TNCV_414251 [Trichonephila clavipes]|nr:hypothetical protein TNCV_414251 [Trichonephila clavipes]